MYDLDGLITQTLATVPSLTEQRGALEKIFGALPGIARVFTRIPTAIQPAHLPAVFLLPGIAKLRSEYAGNVIIERTWQARVYVARFPEGREFDSEAAGEPFLDAIPIALAAFPIVSVAGGDEGSGTAFTIRNVEVSAVQALRYNNQLYAGLTVKFVTETTCTVPRLTP